MPFAKSVDLMLMYYAMGARWSSRTCMSTTHVVLERLIESLGSSVRSASLNLPRHQEWPTT